MTLALGGRRAVMEALRSARAERVLCVRGSRSTEGLRQVLLEAERAGVPVEWVDRERVESLEVRDAQGVVAIVRPPRELDEGGLARVSSDPAALLVILDGITDPQNLGACA
ncbi:MAG: 23S rRNA (guanosine(2251)-2'-O)-methyltransferase RlmB, partial [Actinobacteria bacterium]|nr:23S rRNA (guanosine(2251)-2'-O)-methyltransferase RlmB [Actinomycetota bacterium]